MVAYAGGFAVGTLTGVKLEGIIGLGTRLVRVITTFENLALVNKLREAGFGVTVVPGEGMHGPVFVLISVIKRRSVPEFVKIVKELVQKHFTPLKRPGFQPGDTRPQERLIDLDHKCPIKSPSLFGCSA